MKPSEYIDVLLEKYFGMAKIDNLAVEVFKNPDSGEVDTCFGEDRNEDGASVRGFIFDDTGDLYIWHTDGYTLTHEDLLNDKFGAKNKWKTRPYLPITIDIFDRKKSFSFTAFAYGNSPLRKKLPYDSDEGVSDEINDYMRNNPNVQSLGYKILT